MRHAIYGIPKKWKMLDGREEKSAMYVYSEDGSIILCQQEKEWKKSIVLLTTMNDDVQIPSYYTIT